MDSRKKILEIGPYPPPIAGIQMRMKALLEYILESGYECKLLNIGESRRIKIQGVIDVQNVWDFAWNVFKYLLKGYVIHMHINGKSLKSIWMALYTQGMSCIFFRRAFLTFHAGSEQQYFPKNKKVLLTIGYYLIFVFSKKIICNAQAVKEKIMEYGISGEKIVPIQGFSIRYLQFEKVELPKKIEEILQQHTPILFSYTWFWEEYTVDVFIDVIEKLREIHPRMGVIIVSRSNEGKEEFLSTIRERGLDDIIYVSNNISHDAFLTLIKRVTLYVRTPKDGISSSVLESIMLKIPVVASECGCRPPEAVTFQFGDKDDMLAKILYVLDNYEEVKSRLGLKIGDKDSLDEEIELLMN
ncbi:MAG: glycosyltransferase [Candidatus Desantisbacteria bacterium]